jgi:hypothetical protein
MDGDNDKTTIALRRIEADKIRLINKTVYYKLKYIEDFTILSIILMCGKISMDVRGNKLIIRIIDEHTIYSLSQIDQMLLHELSPVRPILNKDAVGYFITFNLNPIILKIYNRSPQRIYIHLKSIRKSNHLNIPILYLID